MEIRQAEEKDRKILELLASQNGVNFESSIEHTFVSEHDDELIGYISYAPELKEDKWLGKYYETSALVVKQEHLGEGVVTKLIEELTKFIKGKGANLKLKH